MVAYRHYCFTMFGKVVNNWNESKDILLGTKCRYIIFQLEQCPDTKSIHVQGYIEFKERIGVKNIKLLPLFAHAHLESRKGSREQARDYCKKEDTRFSDEFYEAGTWVTPGTRTDLIEVKKVIDNFENYNEKYIADNYFKYWLLYSKYFRRYAFLNPRADIPRSWATEVIVYYGQPGSGKTRQVFEDSPNIHVMERDNNFWSSYNGEPEVLWDDFDGSWIKRTMFLKLADRYPCKIRQIGGYANWNPKKIYITSNDKPEDWYTRHTQAILRRITICKEIKCPA